MMGQVEGPLLRRAKKSDNAEIDTKKEAQAVPHEVDGAPELDGEDRSSEEGDTHYVNGHPVIRNGRHPVPLPERS